jgi:RNase P subunit RPR2
MADVVELFPAADKAAEEGPVRTREREHGRYCSHDKTELDDETRRVYCRHCGQEVPAFDVLRRLARDHERYIGAWRTAHAEAGRAEERLEGLRRQERNIKARVRRAAGQLSETERTALEQLKPLAEIDPFTAGAREAWHEIPAGAILGIWRLAIELHGQSVDEGEAA